MHVELVPCLVDNYAYLLVDPGGEAAVVDPSEAAPVRAAVARLGVRLRAIWNTHHHFDHTGGNEELLAALPGLEVLGHADDAPRIPGLTRALAADEELRLGSLRARVLHTPGHTLGAATYLVEGALFTGDTLFTGGCGRLFEGDAPTLHASLRRLAALPPETRVYPGHEYTLKNLEFARREAPSDPTVAARHEEARRARAQGLPTVPATLATEAATNPFLRAADVSAFAALRARRDVF